VSSRGGLLKAIAAAGVVGMADARAIYADVRPRYAPRRRVPIVPWVEAEYVITKDSGAAFPGPYRFTAVPFWREVAEAFADEATEEIIVAKSSQVGYTELLMAFIAWSMVQDPSSALMIQPTVEMAESWSKERLAPVLRDVPALRGLMRGETKGMARSSDDTLRRKIHPGGWLAIMGANSPAGLASRPVRRVIGDELDRWPVSAGKEGSPLSLAAKRSITYWNRKKIAGGTPTEEGGSPTWEMWEASDQREWHVPCPHCGTTQPLRWKDDDGQYLIVCDRDADGRLVPETARYRCADCAALIDESDKAAMIAAGRWVAKHPGRRLRGYHVWAAYSPWMTWAEIVREFEASRGSEALLRVFVNTILGLPFAPAAEKIDGDKLRSRSEAWGDPAEPPPEVGLLTAGVDVQADRVEYVVTGWGAGERACVLEYGIVEGDPGQRETWEELTAALARDRGGLRVVAVAADTGYRPETVWAWADARLPFRAFPIKGIDGRGRLVMTKPGAVTHKRTRRPWLVGSDTVKDSRAARLRSAPDGPQGVRFSDSLPAEFFDHLTAERLRTVYVGNRPMRKWELIPGRRNEGGDCFDYALAALHGLGPRTVGRLGELAAKRGGAAAPAPEAPRDPDTLDAEDAPAPAVRRAPRRGGWVTGWK
jgi:phage terminase large subunit GpA-like protein